MGGSGKGEKSVKGVKEKIGLTKWLAVVAGGRNEEHTVFRRCAAPEIIRIDRTEGNSSGELGRMGFSG